MAKNFSVITIKTNLFQLTENIISLSYGDEDQTQVSEFLKDKLKNYYSVTLNKVDRKDTQKERENAKSFDLSQEGKKGKVFTKYRTAKKYLTREIHQIKREMKKNKSNDILLELQMPKDNKTAQYTISNGYYLNALGQIQKTKFPTPDKIGESQWIPF